MFQPISEVIGLESHGYRLESRLGSSTSAEVLLVQSIDRPEERFVVKTFAIGTLSDKQKRSALQEVSLLRKLRHKYVVAYIDSWFLGVGPTSARMTVAMEYASGGDLRSPMKVMMELDCFLDELLIKRWLRQVLEALSYVHELGVTHRDIKAMNIFLTDSWRTSLLGDFGVSAVLAKESAFSDCVGTPVYMAPELMRNEPHDGSVDMWAIGVVLYELMAFYRPFDGHSLLATCYKIINTIPSEDPLRDVGYSDAIIDLCMRLLSKEPASRPIAQEVLDDAHLWEEFSMEESEALAAQTCEEASKLLQSSSKDPSASPQGVSPVAGTWSSWGTAEHITEEGAVQQAIRDSWDVPTIETSLPVANGPILQLSPSEAAADAELRQAMLRTLDDDNDCGIIDAERFQALLERLGGAEAASRWTAKVTQRRRDPEAVANDAKDVVEVVSQTAKYLKRREKEESERIARERAAELSGACDPVIVLQFHNALRQRHGAQPLAWDDECAKRAVQLAKEKNADDSKAGVGADAQFLLHNILSGCDSVEAAMQTWCEESGSYDFSASGCLEADVVGRNFAHMVWQSATHVGMAEVDGRFVACYRVNLAYPLDRSANVLPLQPAFAWSPQNEVERALAIFFQRHAAEMEESLGCLYVPAARLAVPFERLGVLGTTISSAVRACPREICQEAAGVAELHCGEFCNVVQNAQDADHMSILKLASFLAADEDDDGRLDGNELKAALLFRKDVDTDVAELLEEFDIDHDDKLSFAEYLALMEALDAGDGLAHSVLLRGWCTEAEDILKDIPLENDDISLAVKVLKKHLGEGKSARVVRTDGKLVVRQLLSAGIFITMRGTWSLDSATQRARAKDHRRESEREELKRRFRELGGHLCGAVNFEELCGLLRDGRSESTAHLSDADVRALMAEVDSSGNGVVNFEEFIDFVFSESEISHRGKTLHDRAPKCKAKAKSRVSKRRSPR